jgi:hypothetical protein
MLDTNIVVLGQIETITQRTAKEIVAAGLGSECTGFADFWPAPGGNVVLFHDPVEADYFTSVIVCEFISGTGTISAEPIHGNQTLRVGRRFFGDGADCFGSVENSRNLTLIPTDAIILRVPLA